jgi:ribonuclease HI
MSEKDAKVEKKIETKIDEKKEAVQKLENESKKSTFRIRCYTDGSRLLKSDRGPAGSGVAIYLFKHKGDQNPKLLATLSKSLGVSTNQIAELTAIEMALDELRTIAKEKKFGYDPSWKVKILSDSKYAINITTSAWKAKVNLELAASSQKKWRKWNKRHIGESKIEWIKAHNGETGNEMADKLAKAAAEKSKNMKEESASSSDDEKESKKRKRDDSDSDVNVSNVKKQKTTYQ